MSILINTKAGEVRAAKHPLFNSKKLGERMRRTRETAGLSQEELAELIGRTNQAVSNWEVGRQTPSCADLYSYGAALGVDLNWLLLGTGKAKGAHLQAVLRIMEG